MLKTNAIFQYKEKELKTNNCTIEKVIWLDNEKFSQFEKNLIRDWDFIRENRDLQYSDNDNRHCLLVMPKEGNDGILVHSSGYDYARYSALLPNARQFLEVEMPVQTMKFYCPLTVGTYEKICDDDPDDYEMNDELQHVDPEAYSDDIQSAIERENQRLDKGGLAPYIHGMENAYKIKSIVPAVKFVNDKLYGVMNVETIEDLSPQDTEELRDYLIGQCSDGYGEGFEQHPIDTCDGEIYVSLWNSNDSYFMKTEAEFLGQEQTETQDMNMGMGEI